jgi:hypothetical protein
VGKMTLGRFRSRLTTILGDRSFDNEDLDDWINAGLYELTGAIDMEELRENVVIRTIPGRQKYFLLNEPYSVSGVLFYNDSRRLLRVGLDILLARSRERGRPDSWARDGKFIVFHPIPDKAEDIQVYGFKEARALEEDEDTTPYRATWDRAILLLGAANALFDVGDSERAVQYLERARQYIGSRVAEPARDSHSEGAGVNVARTLHDVTGRG